VTLSKPPSELPKTSNLDAEARQFLALNRQVYRELLTFIDSAEDFTVGFVEVNFSPNVEMLIQALRAAPNCQDIQFAVMDFSQQPDLRFLRDEIVQRLATLERHPDQKLVLLVLGLKEAIGVNLQGDYPPVLQDLNVVRDAYKRTVPHPMLFFLPDYAITRLAKFAPDFWAWRSGVFLFQTPQVTKNYARAETPSLTSPLILPTFPTLREAAYVRCTRFAFHVACETRLHPTPHHPHLPRRQLIKRLFAQMATILLDQGFQVARAI